MKIRNTRTNRIVDSIELAEELGIDSKKVTDNIRKMRAINGDFYEKVEELVQEIAVENGYLHWNVTDLNAESKPRVIPPLLEGYAENWTAPVGGFDYVLTEKGRRINLKHSPKDPRYNPDIDGTVFKGYGNYLDLNEIKLD